MPLVSTVIVVDDRSTDDTARTAGDAGAFVVRHEKNTGYDDSLNDGFKAAASLGADIIFTFDADGEHDAADVPLVLAPLLQGTADIVAGQRPCVRHWGERIFAAYTRFRYGVSDPVCGFKAYRREVYEAVGFFDSFRSIGTELMIRGVGKGFRLALVPITLHERVDGRSRFYSFNLRGNMRMLRALWHVLWI